MTGPGSGEQRSRLVVDAMNVIGSRPTGWWRDRAAAVRLLADRLDRYAATRGVAITLVVDGRPLPDLPEGDHGRLQVLYARRRGRDAADDRIVEFVDRSAGSPAAAVTVVTADRELRRRVTERGSRVLGPRELLARLDEVDQPER